MKKKVQNGFVCGIFAVLFALAFTACTNSTSEGGGNSVGLTGTVSISGNAEVGQTLSANTTSLNGSRTITYQWKRGTARIGANSSTYTVQAADIGSSITVTVTRAGNSGSITSAPTDIVTDPNLPPLTGIVSISGIAEVGQTLTANTGSLGGEGSISYQWKRGNTVIDQNSYVYSVQAADLGSTITVTVTRSGNSGRLTSQAIGPVTVSPAGIVIDLADIDEWEPTEQTAQAEPGINKVFTVTGTYAAYQWYLDGAAVGTTSSYTFNMPPGVYQLATVVRNSNGEECSGRCRITVKGQTVPLTANVWANGNITDANGEDWYSFPVTSGTWYHIWWNDSKQGTSTKTGDVAVSARFGNSTYFIFGGTNTTVDSGWTSAQSFYSNQTGTVYVRVSVYNRSGSNTGSYGIMYRSASI